MLVAGQYMKDHTFAPFGPCPSLSPMASTIQSQAKAPHPYRTTYWITRTTSSYRSPLRPQSPTTAPRMPGPEPLLATTPASSSLNSVYPNSKVKTLDLQSFCFGCRLATVEQGKGGAAENVRIFLPVHEVHGLLSSSDHLVRYVAFRLQNVIYQPLRLRFGRNDFRPASSLPRPSAQDDTYISLKTHPLTTATCSLRSRKRDELVHRSHNPSEAEQRVFGPRQCHAPGRFEVSILLITRVMDESSLTSGIARLRTE